MDATDPLATFVERARQTLTGLAEHNPLADLQLVPRSEFDSLTEDVSRLREQVATLEARIQELEAQA